MKWADVDGITLQHANFWVNVLPTSFPAWCQSVFLPPIVFIHTSFYIARVGYSNIQLIQLHVSTFERLAYSSHILDQLLNLSFFQNGLKGFTLVIKSKQLRKYFSS